MTVAHHQQDVFEKDETPSEFGVAIFENILDARSSKSLIDWDMNSTCVERRLTMHTYPLKFPLCLGWPQGPYIYIEWIFLELFSTKSLSWSLPFCSMIGFYVYGWCWWYIIESLCYQPYFSRMGSKSEARNPSPLRRRWVARSQCNSVTFEYANVDHFKISFKKGAPIFVHIISYHMFLHISFFHIFFHMFSIYINIYIYMCVCTTPS